MSEPGGSLVLAFKRGGILCAVRAASLRGVAPLVTATRVPGAPPQVRGVIAWRGTVVPLIEPAETFEETWHAAVIVTGEAGEMALAADSIEGWIDAATAPLVIDVDALQLRLRDRIRRGAGSIRPRHVPTPRTHHE